MSEIKEYLTWVWDLIKSKASHRKEARTLAEDAVKNFKKGNPSKEGDTLCSQLKKDFEFIGFAPNISYIKEKGPKDQLEALWVHPFSVPTLLYKHKKLPYLVLVNGNLDFNNTRLSDIKQNASLDGLENILGITG